mgnify:CR=1 FL=1|tara:strand:+ start:38697 stop:39188 length:492 start_codon:yes stop_codon:yes gene_type:complete
MIFRIRVILDVEEDVLRDIEIEANSTLKNLHEAISKSFGFLGNELASFYESDKDWGQVKELPIFSIDDNASMENEKLDQIFKDSQKRLIYVYDFLKMWTFYIELKESGKTISGIDYPNLINSQGDVPEDPPEKKFQTDGDLMSDQSQDNEEDLNLDYNEDSFY